MRRVAVALACTVAATALPAPALAQAPGNGQLAVVQRDRIVAVNTDGSALRTLYAPGSGDAITDPAWSPDGNRLAFVYQRKIAVLDVTTRTTSFLTQPGPASDREPTWSRDGALIGFRRDAGAVQRRLKVVTSGPQAGATPSDRRLDVLPTAFALKSDLDTFAYRLGPLLLWSGGDLELVDGADDTPAWSPQDDALAYVDTGSVWGAGLRVRTFTETPRNFRVVETTAAAPRWAPTGDRLTYVRDGAVMTVGATEDATPSPVRNVADATAVAWQPCVAGKTAACRSVLPPVCNGTGAQVTTQADVPVELPVASCTDPAGLPLRVVTDKDGEHGSLSGTLYTPRPGFIGQDSVSYRMSNGTAQSDPVRVTVFVVPRPASMTPSPGPSNPTVAPYLSLRVKPKLDRRRTALARFSCDQRCTFTVRLEAKLKSKKRALKGTRLKRTLEPGRVLAVRLKLPVKPKGKLRSVWITGTVQGTAGSRPVRLPVTSR